MRIILIALISLYFGLLLAETDTLWTNINGGDFADGFRSVCEANDGSVFSAGYTYSSGTGMADFYLTKSDSNGENVSEYTFGTSGWDYGNDICSSPDGGIVLAGYTTGEGAGKKDILLIKTDQNGNQLWDFVYGGSEDDIAESIIPAFDGGYVICGSTFSNSAGEDDVFVLKVTETGSLSWYYTYGTSHSELAFEIIRSSDNSYVIAASTGEFDIPGGAGRNRDFYLLRINESGQLVNSSVVTGIGSGQQDYDILYSVCETSDNSLYFIGSSSKHLQELMDVYLFKTDSAFNVLWSSREEYGDFYDYGYSVCEANDCNGVIICGSYNTIANRHTSLFLSKIDADGNNLWTYSQSMSGACAGNSVIKTSTNEYIIAGYTYSPAEQNYEAFTAKISDIFLEPVCTATPNTGHAPLTVTFTSQSSGYPEIEQIRWDFNGDGIFDAIGTEVQHTYNQNGYYDVILEVGNNLQTETLTLSEYVRVFDGESCPDFNGETSFANSEATPDLNLRESFTIEGWIFPEGWGEDNSLGGKIFDKNKISVFVCGNHTGFGTENLVVNLKTEGNQNAFCTTSDYSIPLYEWTHLAISYNSQNSELKIYLNGQQATVEILTAPDGQLTDHSSEPLCLGNNTTGNYTFDGLIDEIRFWNSIRTQQQICQNYQHCLNGDENGLIAYWKFNDGYGNSSADNSSNNHSLTLTDTNWMQGIYILSPSTDNEIISPASDFLYQNYPNPFNLNSNERDDSGTKIDFYLRESKHVKITVYNLKGQEVKTLLDDHCMKGNNSVFWNGLDQIGRAVASGIYMYSLETDIGQYSRKMLIIK